MDDNTLISTRTESKARHLRRQDIDGGSDDEDGDVDLSELDVEVGSDRPLASHGPRGSMSFGDNDSKSLIEQPTGPPVPLHIRQERRKARGIPLLRLQGLFTLLNTQSAVHEADDSERRRFKIASQFVQDALEGSQIRVDHAESKHSTVRRLLSDGRYRNALLVNILVYLLLAFWEPRPGTPGFAPWLPIVSAVCLALCTVDLALNFHVFGARQFLGDKKWQSVFLLVVIWSWLDLILLYAIGLYNMFRVSLMARSFLFIAKKKSLRRLVSIIFKTFPSLLDVMGLFGVLVCVFAVCGVQLFNRGQVEGYDPNNDNFDNFPAAVLTMYVLTTSENFPDVLYPAFRSRPASAAIFFGIALILFLWMVIPTILAIVYDVYTEGSAKQLRLKRIKAQQAMVIAYQVLFDDGAATMNLDLFTRFIHFIRPTYADRVILEMFTVLDTDRSGEISIREFLQLDRLLRRFDQSHGKLVTGLRDKQRRALLWMDASADRFFSRIAHTCRVINSADWFKWTRLFIMAAHAILAAIWSISLQEEHNACVAAGNGSCTDAISVMYSLTIFMLVLLWLELIVRMIACDGINHNDGTPYHGRFFGSVSHMFDLFVCTYSTIVVALLINNAEQWISPTAADVFELYRPLMMLRLLSGIRRLRTFISTLVEIMWVSARFAWVYFAITYSFAVVGLAIFRDVPEVPDQYYNFYNLYESMFALFILTVGNDWQNVMYSNIAYTSRWYGWFFVFYFVVCASIMLNIITGVIIEAYSAVLERVRTARADELNARKAELAAHKGEKRVREPWWSRFCCCRRTRMNPGIQDAKEWSNPMSNKANATAATPAAQPQPTPGQAPRGNAPRFSAVELSSMSSGAPAPSTAPQSRLRAPSDRRKPGGNKLDAILGSPEEQEAKTTDAVDPLAAQLGVMPTMTLQPLSEEDILELETSLRSFERRLHKAKIGKARDRWKTAAAAAVRQPLSATPRQARGTVADLTALAEQMRTRNASTASPAAEAGIVSPAAGGAEPVGPPQPAPHHFGPAPSFRSRVAEMQERK